MKKYFITKQDDIKDCGAACISSIIKYYGGYVSLETLRRDSFISKEGISAYHLIECLKKYNFEAAGFKYEDNYLLNDEFFLPVILHLVLKSGLNHFVVLYKVDFVKNKCLIMDPSFGYKKITFDELYNIWSKVIIIARPIGKIPKHKKCKTLLNNFFKLLFEEKKLVIKITIMSFLLTLTGIISSFYIQTVLNNINDINSCFWQFVYLFLIITMLKIFSAYLKNNYEIYLNKNIDQKVIKPFIRHTFFLPLDYIKTKSSGEILTRIKELNNIKNLFSKIFVNIFLDLVLTVITLLFIFRINNNLFFLVLAILMAYIFVAFIFSPKIKQKINDLQNKEADFNSQLVENIEGLETIKNNNCNDEVVTKNNQCFNEELDSEFSFSKLLNKQLLLKNIVEEIGIFLLMTLNILLIINNSLKVVDIITFNSLLYFLLSPFKNVIDLIPEIEYIKSSFNKINDYLNVEEEKIIKSNSFINGNINIKNLSFSYNNYNYILKKCNINIRNREHLLLNGASGSGKSTLCKIIYRLYDYNEGEVMINSKNIKDYDLYTLRNSITYASQREVLFSGTIKDNITFYKEVTDDYFQKIIKICRVDLIINQKNFKEYSYLTAGDYNLSGGEQQRIILARALAKNSQIIILDEVLSEVPEEMERAIIKDILYYFKDRTLIYVSHRNLSDLFKRVIHLESHS